MQNLAARGGSVAHQNGRARAGTSHQFVRPLVIDEQTLVTFRYKRRWQMQPRFCVIPLDAILAYIGEQRLGR
jgi:hypothetical protein